MKKKYLFCLATLTLGLMACENYFDEKYLDNGDPQISVVKTYDYTLTEADYKTIADNKTNKAYAASLDTIEGMTENQDALAQVGALHYFNEIATADMYVPVFIYNKYPQLDPGSVFNVTYNTEVERPDYVVALDGMASFTLTENDYMAIWGKEGVEYISPSTMEDLLMILPQTAVNHCLYVTYNYSSQEPAAGVEAEDTIHALYINSAENGWEIYEPSGFNLIWLPEEANGQALNYLHNTYPYAQKDDELVLMVLDSKTKVYSATRYIHDGTEWIADNGITEETMSFVLSTGWMANLSTYYRQAVAGDGNQGKLVTQDFDLEDGINYIWSFSNAYGMKGTAYYGGPHYGEGWVVTPYIKLKNSTAPALSFDMAMNYGPTVEDGRLEQATVWVSTDYVDDVRTATWTQLPWNEWDNDKQTGFPDANSWTFYNSGRMDLSAWNNQRIVIGFRYKSVAGQTCSTWEVKNILVNEPEEEE